MKTTFHVSAPGRTEISGNHTDHQNGRVLAGAVNLRTRGEVTVTGGNVIRIFSEGYAPVTVELDSLAPREAERNTTAALVRGVAAYFARKGANLQGFDAAVTSNVLPGSGLSSSAAFEVLLAAICNELFCGGTAAPMELAQGGQWAENVYFGKPCGLMDQAACALGGLVYLDFACPEQPRVRRLDVDFARAGYALCILDSGVDHADLTADYGAIPAEMGEIAACFGKTVLREVPEEAFYQALPELKNRVSHRALLRAHHFFQENRRVLSQVQALEEGNMEAFLENVRSSGRSSWMYLQNIVPAGETARQGLALTLALCEKLLHGAGACRVHGGGFAGTVQAYVPLEDLPDFRSAAEQVLGENTCHVLSIAPQGAVRED